MSKVKLTLMIMVLIISPLLLGGLIYIGWRPESLLMFAWFEFLGIDNAVMILRTTLSQYDLPSWMIFWIPNGTWTFAFTASLALIWLQPENLADYLRYRLFWILLPLIFGLTMEAGQLFQILPGTFCFGDIMAHLIGALTALGITAFLLSRFKYLKEENN